MVHSYNEILISSKREQTTGIHNLGGSQGHYAEWKLSISKGYIIWLHFYNISKDKNIKMNRSENAQG